MSAYIVSKSHIEAMLRVGLAGPKGRPVNPGNAWHGLSWYAEDPRTVVAGAIDSADYFRRIGEARRSLDHETVQRVGTMLTLANVASVSARYPDDKPDELPGPTSHYWTEPIRFDVHNARSLTAVEGLVALNGYEYQSCETDDWRDSEAHAFIEALRSALIHALPGYSEADTWDIG